LRRQVPRRSVSLARQKLPYSSAFSVLSKSNIRRRKSPLRSVNYCLQSMSPPQIMMNHTLCLSNRCPPPSRDGKKMFRRLLMLHKTSMLALLNFLRYVPRMSLALIQQFTPQPQQTKCHAAASSSAALRKFSLRAMCICGSKKKQILLFATYATMMHTRKLREEGGGSKARTIPLQTFSK